MSWSAVESAFLTLGKVFPKETVSGFRGVWVRAQPNPGFSPIVWSREEAPSEQQLMALTEFFRQNTNGPVNRPYFCWDVGIAGPVEHAKAQMAPHLHWTVDPHPLHVITVPAGRHHQVELDGTESLPFAGTIPEEIKELWRSGFGANEAAIEHIRQMYTEASGTTEFLLLRSSNGDVAVTGGVTVLGRWAMCTWGTVAASHREQGYIRALTETAAALAGARGAEECVITTRNPRVTGLGPAAAKLYIVRNDLLDKDRNSNDN